MPHFHLSVCRLVHEGLATLVAFRMARSRPATIQVSFNDYGFELSSPADLFVAESAWRDLLAVECLAEDLHECTNTHRVGAAAVQGDRTGRGFGCPGFPGQPKPARALQASSGLLYDVFSKYDDNLLLHQARREILERHLEWNRLRDTLETLTHRRIVKVHCRQLTPFAFPLWADQLGSSLTTETFTSRLEQMLAQLERAAQHLHDPAHRQSGRRRVEYHKIRLRLEFRFCRQELFQIRQAFFEFLDAGQQLRQPAGAGQAFALLVCSHGGIAGACAPPGRSSVTPLRAPSFACGPTRTWPAIPHCAATIT